MTMRTHALLATMVLLAGCSTPDPSISVVHRVVHGATVAVVTFEDCSIANQTDCDGSGAKAAAIFDRVLTQKAGIHTVSLPRPSGPKAPYSDETAVAYAKAKGYRYVMNGEVQDYSHAGVTALRASRAAISLRVLNTSNGQTLMNFTDQEVSKTHLESPDDMLEDMAKQVATSMVTEAKKQHRGDFLIYKGNSG